MGTPKQQLVESHGIYHGLPTYPFSSSSSSSTTTTTTKAHTAIITGANGISGSYMTQVLAQAPHRWHQIYLLSRRPPYAPGGLPPNATHVACDFLQGPEAIADALRAHGVAGAGPRVDAVFYYAYVQPPPKEAGGGLFSDAEELVRVNGLMLANFLGALDLAGVKPARFMLQTGGKTYGIHNGPTKVPAEEGDPRVLIEPNFYYAQEDALWEWCARTGAGWNVSLPMFILGAVPDAAMNVVFPLAVYAVVCAHLGEKLVFPSDIMSWQLPQVASSARLNAYQQEWMVLSEHAKNQRFNTADNSMFSWESTWPRIAGWYGIEWAGPDDKAKFQEADLPFSPPARGYGPPGTERWIFKMPEWAKQPKVLNAWKEIAQTNDLSVKELKDIDRVFQVLDGMLIRGGEMVYSMDKTRKFGWHGMVDTNEALLEVFNEFANMKMIPPVPRVKVSFN